MDSKESGDKESRHLEGISGSEETERKNSIHHEEVLDSEAAEQLNVTETDLSSGRAAEQLNVAEKDLCSGLASASSTMKTSLPIDGVRSDVDFFDAVTCMLGYPVRIYTNTGNVYKGVMSTFSPQFEFALELSSNIHSSNSIKKAIFHSHDVANVEIIVGSDLDFEIGTFQLDPEIDNSQELKKERVLEWDCYESAATDDDDDDQERATASEGWGSDEMLNLKEEEFGVASGLDPKQSINTTPVKNKDSEDDNVAEETIKKVAFELEKHTLANQKSDQNHEHDVEEEVEKFAAQARSLKPENVNKNSANSILKKSLQQPKVVTPSPIAHRARQLSPETSLIENQPRQSQQLPKNHQVKLPKHFSVKKQQSQQQQSPNEQGQEKRQHCSSQRPHLRVDLTSKPSRTSPEPWNDNAHQQMPLRARFYNQPLQMHRMPQRVFHPRSFHSPSFRAWNAYGMPPPFAHTHRPPNRAANYNSSHSIHNNFHASRNPRITGPTQSDKDNIILSTPVYRTGYLTHVSESANTCGIHCCPNTSPRCSSARENVFTVNDQPPYAYSPIDRACTPMHRFFNMTCPFTSTGPQLYAPSGYLPFNCSTGNQWNMMGNNVPPRCCFHPPNVHPPNVHPTNVHPPNVHPWISRANNPFNQ